VWAYSRGQTHRQTDTHTDAGDHNTFFVFYDSRKMYTFNIGNERSLKLSKNKNDIIIVDKEDG